MFRRNTYKPRAGTAHVLHSGRPGFRTVWKPRQTHLSSDSKSSASSILHKQATRQKHVDFSGAKQGMRQLVKTFKTDFRSTQADCETNQQSKNVKIQGSSRTSFAESKTFIQEQQISIESKFESLNLEQLQNKIVEIIKRKIKAKNYHQPITNIQRNQDQIDKQIQKLVLLVKNYKCQMKQNSNDENLNICIDEANQKIRIIEKMMALSSTESKFLNNSFASRNQKNKKIAEDKGRNKLQFFRNMTIGSGLGSNASLNFVTTNMRFFKAPSEDFYKKQNLVAKSVRVINRQPFPKSSYEQDFLHCGGVSTFPTQPLSQSIQNPMKIVESMNVRNNKTTVYQVQFKQKQAKNINSSDFDCKKQKFWNLKMNFYSKKQILTTKLKDDANISKRERISNNPTFLFQKQNTILQQNISKKIKSQFKHKFSGEKGTIESIIKQRNMNKLKNEYEIQLSK